MSLRQVVSLLACIAFLTLSFLTGCGADPDAGPSRPTSLNPGGASFVYTLESTNTGQVGVLKFAAGAKVSQVPQSSLTLPASLEATQRLTS